MQTIEEQVALAKYKLIAAVISDPSIFQKDHFKRMAEKPHRLPGKKETILFRACTFKKWLRIYRKFGLEGLKPHKRKDRGLFRRLTGEHLILFRELTTHHNLEL